MGPLLTGSSGLRPASPSGMATVSSQSGASAAQAGATPVPEPLSPQASRLWAGLHWPGPTFSSDRGPSESKGEPATAKVAEAFASRVPALFGARERLASLARDYARRLGGGAAERYWLLLPAREGGLPVTTPEAD